MEKRERYLDLFDEWCREDQKEIIEVCETASILIWKQFRMKLDDPKLVAVSFKIIFDTIIDKIKAAEKDHKDLKIDICGRLYIGFDDYEDEDAEKNGNFNIYIRHNSSSSAKISKTVDETLEYKERAVQWNTENVINNPKIINDIAIEAHERLKREDIVYPSSTAVFPVFITVYDVLTNYLVRQRVDHDVFCFMINFMNCFRIGCQEDAEVEDENEDSVQNAIIIEPKPSGKQKIKDDMSATNSKDEE